VVCWDGLGIREKVTIAEGRRKKKKKKKEFFFLSFFPAAPRGGMRDDVVMET